MLHSLLRRVINAFQAAAVGLGPEATNAVLVRMVAERLRAQRLKVFIRHAVRGVCFEGRRTVGFIDLAIVGDGIAVGVEVDHLSPRNRSILKLVAAPLNFSIIVLTHPEASAKMPLTIAGIDAIIALKHRNSSGSPAKARPMVSPGRIFF